MDDAAVVDGSAAVGSDDEQAHTQDPTVRESDGADTHPADTDPADTDPADTDLVTGEPRAGTDPGAGGSANPSPRPTGKRRVGAATTRPVAPEGSKRAGGRTTTRRAVAEAPSRQGLLARIGRFLREVVAELRKVIWPTRKELVTYTSVVLAFVTFMVALVAGLDILFARGVLAVFG